MPVKVRCSHCESVVNAPDRARGKAVKCPKCGKAIRVPGEKAKSVAAPPPSSSMLIANLDLDRLEDATNRICPKCGTEVSPEDIECPECHVNLETGLLSAERQAERARKGPNPKQYYREFIRDGLAFWKANKSLSIRLGWYSVAFAALAAGCTLMAFWTVKPLVQDFWLICTAVCLLIPPGLAWNLHTVIIDATMRKKKKIGKYHFDFFQGAALGLKLIFWFIEITFPLQLLVVGLLLLRDRIPPALLIAGGLEAAAVVFGTLLFPIAMVHMSMPVTLRGWLVNKLSKPFFRTYPAVLYWCLFFVLSMLPPLACAGAAAALSAKELGTMWDAARENALTYTIQMEIDAMPKNSKLTPLQQAYEKRQMTPVSVMPLIVPSLLFAASALLFGGVAVFSMRTNGQIGHYFMNQLDLETMTPEVKYVPVAKSIDELESRKGLTWKPVIIGICLVCALGFTLGGSAGMNSRDAGFLYGAAWGMVAAGAATMFVGFFWVLFEAFMDSMIWFGAIQLGWPISFAIRLLLMANYGFGIGLLPFSLGVLPAIVYGFVNWSAAKYPVVILAVGLIYASTGLVLAQQFATVVPE